MSPCDDCAQRVPRSDKPLLLRCLYGYSRHVGFCKHQVPMTVADKIKHAEYLKNVEKVKEYIEEKGFIHTKA